MLGQLQQLCISADDNSKENVFFYLSHQKSNLRWTVLLFEKNSFNPSKIFETQICNMYFFEYVLRNVIWIPTWPVWPPLIHLICTTYVTSNFEQDDTWYVIQILKWLLSTWFAFQDKRKKYFPWHAIEQPNQTTMKSKPFLIRIWMFIYSAEISREFI